MIVIDSDYTCTLSKVTFKHIINSLYFEQKAHFEDDESAIVFVDGDSTNPHSIIKSVYEMRKSGKTVYMVTLLSKGADCSSVIRHLSDYVVDKKITYYDLKCLIISMVAAAPKALADNVFGDIWGDILNSSQKEYRVLKLLLEGYSQYQISQILNLSIKTISGYKVKAVKRHGARNFNELYMLKLHKQHNQF
ncbi:MULTISPECIES: LuxR C-terminal-related transcriptional regulator [Serratia]|uniref:LuxR C-terminal-related transcriptional regulator n=1 Tax=Serratia fonticola TaxID=47917 RepID=A0AAE7EL15_SERFO|nr:MULTISPECIES: LuxR C-terminal-related transcriptional regulator [Serratia]ATM75329.1 hypothetical protein CRN79_05510 [Serratia fonticola]MBE0153539.1 hypothetical protein [Serratia fonticola]QKJ60480.2 LuxR C-terminal-related transcriptional regulator [Serratia fonticola]HEJ9058082.1 hypothetical protein [Serratia fonticola]